MNNLKLLKQAQQALNQLDTSDLSLEEYYAIQDVKAILLFAIANEQNRSRLDTKLKTFVA